MVWTVSDGKVFGKVFRKAFRKEYCGKVCRGKRRGGFPLRHPRHGVSLCRTSLCQGLFGPLFRPLFRNASWPDVVRTGGVLRRVGRTPAAPATVRDAGFSLIGAIITLAVLSGIGLLMMTIAVNFDRLARESRHGAQLEMVLDALLLNYRYREAQGHDHAFYHITMDGLVRVSGPDAPSPERWLDTIEVDIWDEPLPGGKRIWGTARSPFSRRAATLLQYVPETTGE